MRQFQTSVHRVGFQREKDAQVVQGEVQGPVQLQSEGPQAKGTAVQPAAAAGGEDQPVSAAGEDQPRAVSFHGPA